MRLELTIADIQRGTTFVIPREARKGFKYSTAINGGDELCSWTTPCDLLPDLLPTGFSDVRVRNLDTGKWLWGGYLQRPVIHMDEGALQSVDFTAKGYYYTAMFNKFDEQLIFTPPSLGRSSLEAVVVGFIEDVVEYAASRCPGLANIHRIAQTGIPLTEETRSYQNQHPVSIWQDMASMTSYLANPVIWQVYLDHNGFPLLDWFTGPTNPDYWDMGSTSDLELEWDMDDFLNAVSVPWGTSQVWTLPTGSNPTLNKDVVGGPYTKRKVVNVGTDFYSFEAVKTFAQGLMTRFSEMRITGGSGTLRRDVQGPLNSVVEPCEVRAGHIIQFTLPQQLKLNTPEGFYRGNTGLIHSTDFDEEGCGLSFQLKPFSDQDETVRIINVLSSQRAVAWATTIPSMDVAFPVNDKVPVLGYQQPERSRTTDEAALRQVNPLAAMTDSKNDFGEAGGQIHPEWLPTEPVNINTLIPANNFDPDTGEPIVLKAEEDIVSEEVQHCYVKRFRLRAKKGQIGTVTVRVDKMDPKTKAIEAGFMKATISAGNFVQVTYKPAKIINDGDILIYNVPEDAKGKITQVSTYTRGDKRWPQFPVYQKPKAVVGGTHTANRPLPNS